MSRKEKILEIVHSGAARAVQEEPEVRRDKTGGWVRALTAQASNGKGEEQSATWAATAIVQARREGEEKREGRKPVHQVTAGGPGRERSAGEKSYPTLRERSARKDKVTKKLPHLHSQETALPLTCDPKSAFSDPRGSTRLLSFL